MLSPASPKPASAPLESAAVAPAREFEDSRGKASLTLRGAHHRFARPDHMRKSVSSALAIAAALLCGAARAADFPAREAPPAGFAPAPPPWSGFYLGLSAGYGWNAGGGASTASLPLLDGIAVTANGFDPPNISAGGLVPGAAAFASAGRASIDPSGFVGGGHIGYNFLAGERLLLGLEADMQGAAIRGGGAHAGLFRDSISWNDGPGAHPCGPTVDCLLDRSSIGFGRVDAAVDWLGTARGRLGYLVAPELLIYATGGLAYGGARASAAHVSVTQGVMTHLNPPFDGFNGVYVLTPVAGAARYSGTRAGWTLGGGGEWMFAPNWSVRLEALYYDLGTVSLAASPVAALSPIAVAAPGGIAVAAGQLLGAHLPTTRLRFDGVVARAGVSFHFGGAR
jgi:opacity protein-like surface antigen